MRHIVIIGNGISGITTARNIRKLSNDKITVISSETKYFFSRTALMYIYMGHMNYNHTKPYEDHFWEKNRIDLLMEQVDSVDTTSKTLEFSNNHKLSYDILVLATGSKPNKFGWPGQDLKGVQGLYSYQDLETMETYTSNIKRAVIVGGGLIGVEMAEMLICREIPVTFLVRESRFWGGVLPKEEGNLVVRHMLEHHVDLRLNTELKEIIPDENGRAKAIITNKNEKIECGFVGLTAGVSPNIGFLASSNIDTDRGILINNFLETNIENVYAIGDCAQFKPPIKGRKAIEQVWYTGRMMGETLAQTICGTRTEYKPGIWFNSAKFFDIEYQTYGWVLNNLKENESQFYWEHPNGKICLKMVFNQKTKELIGINAFGIRLRHELLDRWLNEKKTVEYVLERIRDANFDPEFYKSHERDIINKYNQEFGTKIKPKKKNLLNIFG